ncbi:MAG: short-chain fatty acid transporter, partial [Flavobacteriales bacterium]|nr:short-chain fatty acid transporter [Flavobacteriales bacterium]
IGAAGYTSMLVWHGGLSGSAPLKVAEAGHLQELGGGEDWVTALPDVIGLRETVFSSWSLALTATVALAAFGVFAWLGRTVKAVSDDAAQTESAPAAAPEPAPLTPADQLDQRRGLSLLAGVLCFAGAIWWAQQGPPISQLRFITPDWINLLLLSLALMAHPSMRDFLNALDEAISGASGILVQFPIYFGIMGMVTGTELGTWLADGLVGATSRAWLPVALFTSSGILNVFVPSGGGQWAVQGPLVLESCQALGLDLPRGIMAMAYGDQLTNMLQPFWALPLLGITGLKARDILPYTLMLMMITGAVMLIGMLMWGAG